MKQIVSDLKAEFGKRQDEKNCPHTKLEDALTFAKDVFALFDNELKRKREALE